MKTKKVKTKEPQPDGVIAHTYNLNRSTHQSEATLDYIVSSRPGQVEL